MASAPPRDPGVPAFWDRIPDPSVIRVSTFKGANVSLQEVEIVVRPYLSLLGVPKETYYFEGPQVGKAFTLEFEGLQHLAAKQALKVIKGLKKGDNDFHKFEVPDPSGNLVPIFLNFDKNGQQIQTERVTKKLAESEET